MSKHSDPDLARALSRYEVISAYLALKPGRGQRGAFLQKLASQKWPGPDGTPVEFSAETLRSWIRRYRTKGLDGLRDASKRPQELQALTPEQIELVCRLKKEVPERSLERIIDIAEEMKLIEKGVLRRTTLHRVLRSAGLSRMGCRVPDTQDLDRFEADHAGALWQSDMLVGPWLPDPEKPGASRRAYLYAVLDDYSRLLLYGRFSFKGDLPALELVFRRCLQRFGRCRRVYYDNGQTYRSEHMRRVVATLGMQSITFTKVHRPMGHGKIEAFNHLVRNGFLAELRTADIRTLDQLNEAFLAWVDLYYNRRVHRETGQTPLDRWQADIVHVQYIDDEQLRQAFLWREDRTPDKTGLFSLMGVRYQVGPELARRRIEVRYDPEVLQEVEVWHDGKMQERVRPFEVHAHRRPKPSASETAVVDPVDKRPVANWLGHLVQKRTSSRIAERTPRDVFEQAASRRGEADRAVTDMLEERLDPAVFDADAVRDFLRQYGPFNPERAQTALDRMLASGRADQHISLYLDALRIDARSES